MNEIGGNIFSCEDKENFQNLTLQPNIVFTTQKFCSPDSFYAVLLHVLLR